MLPVSVYPYLSYPGIVSCAQTWMNSSHFKLSVEGNGSVRVNPDTAIVIFGVSTENKQLKTAQEENAVRVTKILDTLKTLGVSSKDIETQSYTINPQYDYIEGKQVFRSYEVSHILRVTSKELRRVGEMIDAVVESGANIIRDVNFSVIEPSVYYRQALDHAIGDAVAKAEAIGKKLKVRVSNIPVDIIEESYESIPLISTHEFAAPQVVTPIQTGQIEIRARIKAVFIYIPI